MQTLLPELLVKICVELDIHDISKICQTCKHLSLIGKIDYLWKLKFEKKSYTFFEPFEAPNYFIKFVIDGLYLDATNVLPFLYSWDELEWLKFAIVANVFCERYDIWDKENGRSIYFENMLVEIKVGGSGNGNGNGCDVKYYFLDSDCKARKLMLKKEYGVGVGKVVKKFDSYRISCFRNDGVVGVEWKEMLEGKDVLEEEDSFGVHELGELDVQGRLDLEKVLYYYVRVTTQVLQVYYKKYMKNVGIREFARDYVGKMGLG